MWQFTKPTFEGLILTMIQGNTIAIIIIIVIIAIQLTDGKGPDS